MSALKEVLLALAVDAYDANQYRGVIGASKEKREKAKAEGAEAVDTVTKLIEALTETADRLAVVIESDNEDHGGAGAEDVAAYERAMAILKRIGGTP